MIHVVKGDLLKSDCNVIIHQCNCFAKMGAGIAKQIAKKYPEAYLADKNFHIPVGSKNRVGQHSVARTSNDKLIFNMYSQYHYSSRNRQTDYLAFEHALKFVLIEAMHSRLSNIKIGMPYGIGCGLAGGDWKIVQQIIMNISEDKNIDIYLYKFG